MVSRGGLHTRIVVKDEAPDRPKWPNSSWIGLMHWPSVCKQTVTRYDRWDYAMKLIKPTANFWQKVAEALAKKTGGLDVGVGWPASRAVKLTSKAGA